jgi:hypothetical protein
MIKLHQSFVLVGGPCKYVLKEGSGLSNNWLVAHVAPNIAQNCSKEVAALLGKALLWAIFDDVASARVLTQICTRIMSAYNSLDAQHRLQNSKNPVKKIRLVTSGGGSDGEDYVDEVPEDVDPGQEAGVPACPEAHREGNGDQLFAIYGRVTSLDRKTDDCFNEDRQYMAQMNCRLQTLESNTSRIALQPVQRVRQ